jgi:hypothetical protein
MMYAPALGPRPAAGDVWGGRRTCGELKADVDRARGPSTGKRAVPVVLIKPLNVSYQSAQDHLSLREYFGLREDTFIALGGELRRLGRMT